MSEEVDDRLETLPRPAARSGETSERFTLYVSTLLITLGWLIGLAVAGVSVFCAVVILKGEPQRIPWSLLDEWWPAFRDRPTFLGIVVGTSGLLVAMVVLLLTAGMGHVLRLFIRMDGRVRRLIARLDEMEERT